jgi:proteasome lid subunit RPN8/RPN11
VTGRPAARLSLPSAVAELMLAHARAAVPNEACGLLSGSSAAGVATTFHPARNAHASPLRYTIHDDDLRRITFAIDEAGDDLVAVFHSHTRTAAVPSPTDRRWATLYPDAVQLIASLAVDATGPAEALRAWRIRDDAADEIRLRLT